MWTFLVGTIVFISTLAWAQNRKKEAPKIVGIYSPPGKWYYLKYIAFLLLLKTRRFFKRARGGGLGQGLGEDIGRWDKPQQLSDDDKAFDAAFFHGVTQDGYYLATGVERRHGGKANALIYLVVSCVFIKRKHRVIGFKTKFFSVKTDKILKSIRSLGHQRSRCVLLVAYTPNKKWKSREISFSKSYPQDRSIMSFIKIEGFKLIIYF